MVKEGYKETEIGIIPEEWKVKKLNDIATPKARIGWQNLRKEEYLTVGDYLLITGTDFSDGKIMLDKCYYVSKERYIQDKNIQISNGSILITKDGTLGKIAFVEGLNNPATLNAGIFVLNNLDDGVDNRFLYQYLRTGALLDYAYKTSTGGTIRHLNQNVLIDFCVPCPSLHEQKNIAEALSDIDNLISSLEKVIEKKKAIKQACLQKMFPKYGETTPEMRLPGYTEPWEQRKLGDMMNITSVKRIHQSDWTDSGVRFLRARDIVAAAQNEEPDDYLYISKEKYEEYSALSGKVDVSDLLVTGVGTIGVPYLVRNLEPLYFKDGNIIWFQNSGKIDGKFLLYSFWGEQIQKFINESAGIGTVGTYTIESGKKTPILFPSKMEQEKIGVFFQQLDNLITLHQRKLEKYKKIKQGMMQQLLTGKIRLL